MEEFWILILLLFFTTNSLDKAASVKLELKTFDEIFGEGWWDKGEAAEDLKRPPSTNFRQNVHHQNDRQDTQLGQTEPYSTDQNPPLTDQIDETVAKELGLSLRTISNWKRELGQTTPKQKYSHSEQKELMKRYYEIKDQNSKISVADIAKMLKIGKNTLIRWNRQFKRQQFHQNSVVGHSVEENATANIQEIGHSNSESI